MPISHQTISRINYWFGIFFIFNKNFKKMKKIYLTFLLGVGAACFYAQQTFTNFQNATLVIGQANFTTNSTLVNQNTLFGTTSSAISSQGVLACGSQSARRVLIWNTLPTANGTNADVAVGVPNFITTGTGCTQNSTSYIEGIAFSPDGTKLIVADAGNNRVLIWNSIPTVNGQNADVVIGQTNFTTSIAAVTSATSLNYPTGVLVTPNGKLIISDYNNSRVLIYNTIPTTNGATADVVIGQNTFTTSTGGVSANAINHPWYLSISQTGQLLFADHYNHRTLVYNSIPVTNGAAANVVIGQPTFTSNTPGVSQSLANYPIGVTCAPDGKLAIAEYSNNRVMIYNSIPTSNGANADVVLGQPNFTSTTPFNGGVSAQSMQSPYGIWFDLNGRLFVNGRDMNRVMVFGAVPTQTADLAISMVASSTSLCVNSNVSYTVTVTNNGPSTASNVVVNTALPAVFNLTGSTATAGTYSAISGWWNIPSISNGSTAVLYLNGNVSVSNQTIFAYANITNSQQLDNLLSNNGISSTVAISSATPPVVSSITNSSLACSNNSYTFAAISSTNTTGYTWSASNATVTGTGSLVTVLFGSANSTISVIPSSSVCTGSAAAQSVSVTPTPVVAANTSNSLICSGQTVSLTATGAATYSWNTTATTSVIAVTPSLTTSYTVTGTANGCSASSVISQSVSACTGIAQNTISYNALVIYPNPNSGLFTISATSEITLNVINNLGQVVKTVSLTEANNYNTSVSDLSSGIYFIVSNNNTQFITKKIVVAK